MPDFSIKLTDDAQQKVDGLAKAGLIDLRPVLAVIGTGYRKEVALIFSHQQPRETGQRWQQLSDNPPGKGYASWKAKHFPGKGILVRTGSLLDSMTVEGAEGNISIITKAGAVFGSSISYGIYHDSDESRKGNLPQRNFSEPSDARLQIWLGQIRDSIIHNFEVNHIEVDADQGIISD